MFRFRINGDIHTDSQLEIWYRKEFQTQIDFKQSFFNENCHCPLPLEDFYKGISYETRPGPAQVTATW